MISLLERWRETDSIVFLLPLNIFSLFSSRPLSFLPFLLQIFAISPGADFTKICIPLLFSTTPISPFWSLRSGIPISDFFPRSAHFAPFASVVHRSLLQCAFKNIFYSLTSSPFILPSHVLSLFTVFSFPLIFFCSPTRFIFPFLFWSSFYYSLL